VINGLPDGAEIGDEFLHVDESLLVVETNLVELGTDAVLKRVNLVVDSSDGALKSLESDKKLGLNLDSFLVVVLVPDIAVVIELPDLLVEVGTREDLTTVWVLVVGRLVARVRVVVVALRVGLTTDVVAGTLSGGVNLGLRLDFGALNKSNRSEK